MRRLPGSLGLTVIDTSQIVKAINTQPTRPPPPPPRPPPPKMLRGLGADEESDSVILRRVDTGIAQLLEFNRKEDERRKIALVFTAAGVLFAAVKLGFIVVPHIRTWRESR